MRPIADWPTTTALASARLEMQPLQTHDAEELAELFDDSRLHEFIGGSPDSADELRVRYTRQVVGHSPDRSERWFNWILRHRSTGSAVGTVQATVADRTGVIVAEVAWIVAVGHQHQGYARESAATMVAWLREQGAETIIAHIHPDHRASTAVARALGLTPTDQVVDGELRWVG